MEQGAREGWQQVMQKCRQERRMPKRRSAAGSSEQMDGEGESQRGLSAPNRAGGTSEHFQLLRPGEGGVVGRFLRMGLVQSADERAWGQEGCAARQWLKWPFHTAQGSKKQA